MKQFLSFVLNLTTYGFIIVAGLLWIHGVFPKPAEKFFIVKKRTIETASTVFTFLAFALVIASVYLPSLTKQPFTLTKYFTAPLLVAFAAVTLILLIFKKGVNRLALLQSIALLTLTASIFRLY
jgi:hypothetical protein